VEVEICYRLLPAAASDSSFATPQGKERREQVQSAHDAMMEPDAKLGRPRIAGQQHASGVGGGTLQRQPGSRFFALGSHRVAGLLE